LTGKRVILNLETGRASLRLMISIPNPETRRMDLSLMGKRAIVSLETRRASLSLTAKKINPRGPATRGGIVQSRVTSQELLESNPVRERLKGQPCPIFQGSARSGKALSLENRFLEARTKKGRPAPILMGNLRPWKMKFLVERVRVGRICSKTAS
jgi:hypothetical protein